MIIDPVLPTSFRWGSAIDLYEKLQEEPKKEKKKKQKQKQKNKTAAAGTIIVLEREIKVNNKSNNKRVE